MGPVHKLCLVREGCSVILGQGCQEICQGAKVQFGHAVHRPHATARQMRQFPGRLQVQVHLYIGSDTRLLHTKTRMQRPIAAQL